MVRFVNIDFPLQAIHDNENYIVAGDFNTTTHKRHDTGGLLQALTANIGDYIYQEYSIDGAGRQQGALPATIAGGELTLYFKTTATAATQDVTIEKIWDDTDDLQGKRTASVEVELLAGDAVVPDTPHAILSETNGWTASYINLPALAEDEQYSVREIDVPSGYDVSYLTTDIGYLVINANSDATGWYLPPVTPDPEQPALPTVPQEPGGGEEDSDYDGDSESGDVGNGAGSNGSAETNPNGNSEHESNLASDGVMPFSGDLAFTTVLLIGLMALAGTVFAHSAYKKKQSYS
jgi:hypothetical protein